MLSEGFRSIPIPNISSVDNRSVVGDRALEIHTSHDAIVFKTIALTGEFDELLNDIEALRNDND